MTNLNNNNPSNNEEVVLYISLKENEAKDFFLNDFKPNQQFCTSKTDSEYYVKIKVDPNKVTILDYRVNMQVGDRTYPEQLNPGQGMSLKDYLKEEVRLQQNSQKAGIKSKFSFTINPQSVSKDDIIKLSDKMQAIKKSISLQDLCKNKIVNNKTLSNNFTKKEEPAQNIFPELRNQINQIDNQI